MSVAPKLLHQLVTHAAELQPEAVALSLSGQVTEYADLAQRMSVFSQGLRSLGLAAGDRIAIMLPKSADSVAIMLAASAASLILVPVNPILRSRQLIHLLRDSGARLLVTSPDRLTRLGDIAGACPQLEYCLLPDAEADIPEAQGTALQMLGFDDLRQAATSSAWHDVDSDATAMLFYTSGSTGLPKAVMVTHHNLLAGARAVVQVHKTDARERVLALLPLSFDAGFSQLTTAFSAAAEVVLAEHYLATQSLAAAAEREVTSITGVPPLWQQLAAVEWPDALAKSVRCFATTGGVMPPVLSRKLRRLMPNARAYLMYGFTEAFRATILPAEAIDQRPDSMGLAIPGAELFVLRPDGNRCEPGEAGELVQAGELVSQGYWQNPAATKARFRTLPAALSGSSSRAVWSGDIVHQDADGFFYFHHRNDQMIKTSGYRVSPDEVESVLLDSGLVAEAVVAGIADSQLGQALVAAVVLTDADTELEPLAAFCRRELPAYLCPTRFHVFSSLPRSPNGKYDRKAVRERLEQAED